MDNMFYRKVPIDGTEWLYNGKRVRVVKTVVLWEYAEGNKNVYEATLSVWAEGKSFQPLPEIPEVGSHYTNAVLRFVVLDVVGETVFGRERTHYEPNDWYAASYSVTELRKNFVKERA